MPRRTDIYEAVRLEELVKKLKAELAETREAKEAAYQMLYRVSLAFGARYPGLPPDTRARYVVSHLESVIVERDHLRMTVKTLSGGSYERVSEGLDGCWFSEPQMSVCVSCMRTLPIKALTTDPRIRLQAKLLHDGPVCVDREECAEWVAREGSRYIVKAPDEEGKP